MPRPKKKKRRGARPPRIPIADPAEFYAEKQGAFFEARSMNWKRDIRLAEAGIPSPCVWPEAALNYSR